MIVVTAPTGNIGSHVVANLLARRANVRMIVRDAGKLSEKVRDQVQIVEGSHGDAGTVDSAFECAAVIFWLAPPDTLLTLEQAYLDFTRPAVEAIRRHKVARVVSITALGAARRGKTMQGLSPRRSAWLCRFDARKGRRHG